MRKILFLDIDWVLNNDLWDISKERKWVERKKGFPMRDLDPECLKRLKEIVDKTNCEVWLSSTWRTLTKKQFKGRYEDCFDLFKQLGIPLSGVTPILFKKRGYEIQQIIDTEKPDVYAIVDDVDEMLDEQRPYFVHTTMTYGLDNKSKDKLIEILNNKQ